MPPLPKKGYYDSIDWRDYDAVTPVRDQGQCGVCYSFVAVGQIESVHYIEWLLKYQLSVQ